MLDQQIRHRFAADFAAVHFLDAPAHLAQHFDQAGAGRVEADVFDGEFAARYNQRGDHEERGGAGIAGDFDDLRCQFGFAANPDCAGAGRIDLNRQVSSEPAQHPF